MDIPFALVSLGQSVVWAAQAFRWLKPYDSQDAEARKTSTHTQRSPETDKWLRVLQEAAKVRGLKLKTGDHSP